MKFSTLHELDPCEGSVQLVEALSTDHAHLKGSDVVLVPQPSDDPNDPLRWPVWRKWAAFTSIITFCAFFSFNINGIGPALLDVAEDFQISPTKTSSLLTWCVLGAGLGNFIWVPAAIYFGRRPVWLLTCTIAFCFAIWAALAKNLNSLLAARVVVSIAGSNTEALGAIMVNDIFFLHERAQKMSIYILFLGAGSSLGPLCAGYIASAGGWRWVVWTTVIGLGLNVLAVIILVPETRFDRNYGENITLPTNAIDATNLTPHTDLSAKFEEPLMEVKDLEQFPTRNTIPVTKKSYLKQLSPWSGTKKNVNIFSIFVRPFPMLAYPAVILSILSYAVSLACVIFSTSFYSFIFSAPPYNFSAGTAGLINIPSTIGNIVGAISGGWLTDKYATWRARRNNGIFVPESRLPMLIIPAICVPVGLLMFGFCATKHLHWAIGYVGFGFIGVGLTNVASITMTYVIDSYYPIAAECMVTVNATKNVVAFGVLYGVAPWVAESGYQKVFGSLSGIYLGVMLLAVVFYVFGARIRHYTSTHFKLIYWQIGKSD